MDYKIRSTMTDQPIDVVKLDQALTWVDEIMQRCSMDYLLFGDTAYSILNNTKPIYNQIYLGVLKPDFTEFSRNMLQTMVPTVEITDHKINFAYEEIPIMIRIVYKDYGFLTNPQMIAYALDNYWIPNPFEDYWKVYRMVQ